MTKVNTFLVMLLCVAMSNAQTFGFGTKYGYQDKEDSYYVNASFDANNSFQFVKNNRRDHAPGLNWKIEIGATYKWARVFVKYEELSVIDFKHYAAGVGYVIRQNLLPNLTVTPSIHYGTIIRGEGQTYQAVGFPMEIAYRINKNIAITALPEYQFRPENNDGIPQLKIGVSYILHRKN